MVTMNGEETAVGLPVVTPMLDHHTHMLDDDDDAMSDDSESQFTDGHDLMSATMDDEVTAQLAAAGPVGMAAAAAIASAKKRKRPHQFETNPSIRKRQQTRLLRKLRQTIDEFTIRVGMQAVVTVAIPGKPQNSFKCFGAKPLEDVIRNLRPTIMAELESALAQHAPTPAPEDPTLHELPPLVIDGIPTPVEKMTQAQLRAFIPLMLKYSTGRGKPGWGKESTRPPWWPQDLPWANVRMDARTEDEKQKVSWTHALRQIVINCYKYHGREDLLPVFSGDHEDADIKPQINKLGKSEKMYQICEFLKPGNQDKYEVLVGGSQVGQYGPTVLQTISNPDGTVSIIQIDGTAKSVFQMDPTNSIITLPDGTTAQVQGVATLQSNDGQVHQLGDGSMHQEGVDGMPVTVDLNSMAHASLGQEGQIILTGEDGHAYPVTVSGMITVPVPHNMYQTVMANISSIQTQNADGSLQYQVVNNNNKKGQRMIARLNNRNHQKNNTYSISQTHTVLSEDLSNVISIESHHQEVVTPMVLPKVEPGTEGEPTRIPVSAITGDPSQTQIVTVNANGQVIHNDKIYQICEFLKPSGEGGQEKVIMMTQVGGPGQSDEGEEQECIVGNGHTMETTITMETDEESQQIEQEDHDPEEDRVTQEVTEEELAEQETQGMEHEDVETDVQTTEDS